MRVLIIGASGYIAQRAAIRLVADGHQVTGFVRSAESATKAADAVSNCIVASLDDADAVKSALDAHDAVIWLAQLSLDEEKRVVGALLKALRNSGKTFIFTGGASVLSEPTKGEWSDNSFAETDTFVPRRELAIRAETESMVRIAVQSGVRSVVVRPPLVYGRGGCRVIADLYHSARKTGSVCYIGRGLNVYSSVHVDDLARLYTLILERGRAGALYHCVGAETNFRTMAETVAKTLGVGVRSLTIEQAQEVWDRFTGATVFASCSRVRSPLTRAELGWTADPSRSDILEECLDPAYAAEGERVLASWIKPTDTAGRSTVAH